jgi:hypothetical protein
MVLRVSLLSLALASSALAQRDTTFTWSRKLPDGARFAIRNLNGAIEVRAGTTDRVEVSATIRSDARGLARDLSFEVREPAPDNIEICTIQAGSNACDQDDMGGDHQVSVRYTVDIPRGLHFRATTTNGNVIVMQTVSEIDVTTGNGDIVVRESESRASATSGNGDVTIAAANGPVRASSGNGRVMVNTALGPVNASSGNGDVEVRMISVAPGREQPAMSLSSGNGDIRLTLPSDFNGEIDASTGHDGIKTDFSVRTSGRMGKTRLQGTVGNGNGPLIKLNSGNGRLEIRKG